jgi:biopolymer transport protein ExbD
MYVPVTKTIHEFKVVALIAVISPLLIIYMIFSKSIDSGRILIKLPVWQADVEALELEPEAKLPPITRKLPFQS